ncbi:hypothetical protein [Sorangium sp. So ce854]
MTQLHQQTTGDGRTGPGQIVRVNEVHVWFLSEHLVDTPLVKAR